MELDLSGLTQVEVLLIAVAGLSVMFAGYRIKKVAFFLIWFILGYYLVHMFLPHIPNPVPDVINDGLFQALLPIAGGLLLALLGFSIEKLCVGGICFVLVMLVTVQYFGTEMQTLAIGGVVGVIAAGAAVMVMKPATIIATSLAGAYAVTIALLVLIPTINRQVAYFPSLVAMTAVGAIVQFLTTKRIK